MWTSRILCFGSALVMGIAGYLVIPRTALHAQQGTPVSIGGNDIGGVVSSSKGPEAGVWVIAETTDLPTRYIKEVVTDDRGRYLIPDLPKAKYTVWARGYGLGGFAQGAGRARQAGGSETDGCAGCEDRRAILSGQLLVFPAEGAREKRISRDRPHRKRHFTERDEPGPVDPPDQDRQL